MPSDSSLKAFLSSLSPEDVATLFAGLRNTLPIGMGVYSPELNAGEAEIVGKRQAEREAARVREMEILSRLLPQAMAKRQAAIPESGADPFVPTRPRIMRESPFMFTQPRATPVPQQYAVGGSVLPDQTTPDIGDSGQMLSDPQPFAGGGSVLKSALGLAEKPTKTNIKSLIEKVRNEEGTFEARRLERAADEVPNLESMYREGALERLFGGDNARALMTMRPRDFEKYAAPLKPRPSFVAGSGPKKENMSTDEYIRYLSGVNKFHDVPFLEIDKKMQGSTSLPFIVGHEGRHRNRALAERGEQAGLVQLLPRSQLREPFPRRDREDYLEALRKELSLTGGMVRPESYFDDTLGDNVKRGAIKLPEPYAQGGSVQPFAGGGKAEALKLLKGDLWHGGTYTKGDKITRPLYTTPDKEMAESYADKFSNPGSVLQRLRVDVKNPAPERLVRAASRKFVPENEASGYTPASAFDDNINDPAGIAAMIRELRRRGYDSAVATDIGMGRGATEAPALVLFPGSKAYQKGGSVFGKKSLDEMQAELLSKEGLSRRALFGLKPDYPLAKTPEPLSKVEQEVKRAEQSARSQGQAPSVTASRVDVDPGTGRKKSIMESVTETPVSRRTVLKTAGSQVAQNVLPMGDLMKLAGAPAVTSPVGAIAQATKAARPTVPLVPLTAQGVIARAARMGLDEDETIALLEKMNVADEYDVLYMMPGMRNPYDFYEDFGSEQMSRARALANLINTDMNKPMQMRGPLREIKRENPDMYKELKEAAQDIYDYGQEF